MSEPAERADGRVALVTGASRGIGRATATALAQNGARVAVGYASDADAAAETVAAITATGGTAFSVEISVEDRESVDEAFTAIESDLGAVEILVNNAGVTGDGLIVRMSDEQWDRVLDINLTGAFHTIRRAVPKMMRARFGRIVNVSSVVAHVGGPGQANYAASKAGLLGLTRSVARELASRSITCNVVAPGPIATAMTEAMGEKWLETVSGLVPLGRPGTPEDCAAAVAFIASDAAGYITGALIPVDGGLGMGF
ncbi:MAG: 3-oxoacyl-[acyl-carrier-protein] reductase [Acidimicrobiia bacterium]